MHGSSNRSQGQRAYNMAARRESVAAVCHRERGKRRGEENRREEERKIEQKRGEM